MARRKWHTCQFLVLTSADVAAWQRGSVQFYCAATLFAWERVTGIEPAHSAWESDTDPPSTLLGPI